MTTIAEGWINHAAPYGTPPAYTALSYFGLPLPGEDAMLDAPLQYAIKELTEFGSYSPVSSDVGSKLADNVKLAYVPVNGLFLWWQLGKVSGAGTKTIVPMDGAARKQHIGTWQQTGTKKYYHAGVVVHETALNYDYKSGFNVNSMGKGMAHGSSATSPTFTFPTSISSPFVHFNTMTWNAGAVLPVTRFTMAISQPIAGFIDADGNFYQELNEFVPMSYAYNIQFSATDGEALMTDYQAGTARTLIWKITKADASKYIQCTQTCTIFTLVPTRTYGKDTIYSATLRGLAPSFEVVDGVADAFYGL